MALHGKEIAIMITGLALLSSPASSKTRLCESENVTVSFQLEEHAELVCKGVRKAKVLFENCGMPSLSTPLRIDVVEDLIGDCLGQNHCGGNLIEIISPAVMQGRGEPDGVFAHLSSGKYFQSVLIHELAHAATDGMPCPFDFCHVGPEYVAYSMQVMSLSREEQMLFEQSIDMDHLISVEHLHSLVLFMAPDVFTQRVWAHLKQREAPCEFLGQLINGEVIIDFETVEPE